MTFGKIGIGGLLSRYPIPYRYITKGLVSYFDSEVGFSQEAGTWKDLATGITYPVSVRSVASSGAVMLKQDLLIPWSWGATCSLFYTIGNVANGSWKDKCPLALVSGDKVVVGLEIRNDWTSTRLTIDGQEGTSSYDGSVINAQSVVTYDGTTARKYMRGVKKRPWEIQNYTTPANIRIQNSYSTPGGRWHIYRTLAYNRALTADEIAHNYKIDQARFLTT